MTRAMEKRLECLEKRQTPWMPPPDMSGFYDAIMADCEANEAGRPYSHWSRPQDEPPPPISDEVQRTIDYLDAMSKRLREQEGFAEWEAERAKRLAATVRAIEREQAARLAAEAAGERHR
jgi:hypothetical protein